MKYNYRTDSFHCDACGTLIMTKDEVFETANWDCLEMLLSYSPAAAEGWNPRAGFNREKRKAR